MNADLIVRLQAQAETLSTRVLDEMYRQPFWMARFGERGRQFARQDGQFHLSYLVQALVASEPAVLTGYARWLQSVLTTRGMCTRHIDENFARLARAIGETVADAGEAVELLEQARLALRYPPGRARELQDESAALVAELLRDRGLGDEGSPDSVLDVADLVSYLADATALDRPAVFVDHVRWLATTPEARHLAGLLDHLARAVAVPERFSAAAAATAGVYLAEARDYLERGMRQEEP